MKKFIITENEKRNILGMYGLITEQTSETPMCTNSGCKGKYSGPEFNQQGDIAHQYSNTITQSVAKKLKELYTSGDYVKVDFDNIKMTTKGMGTGNVVYEIEIPFMSTSKCDAMTGFAHVGGWNHTPELNNRKRELLSYIPQGETQNMILDNKLYVSGLKTTKEGLQEYWIQWKNRKLQSDCSSNNKKENTTVINSTEKIERIDHNNDPNLLRERLKKMGTVINPSIKYVGNDNGYVEVKYLTSCPGDGICEKVNLSYVFSNSGEEDKVLNKVKSKNTVIDDMEYSMKGFKGYLIQMAP
jgi:hypothetical protein